MARKLTRIPTGNPAVDRWLDNVVATLNPVLSKRVLSDDAPPVVTGSRGGNAALASLLSALDSLGLIKDETT